MKYKIIKNEKRNTLSVVLSPVVFNFTKYLYERFNNTKFFATGVLDKQDYKEDIIPFVNELVTHLNELAKGTLPPTEQFIVGDIISVKDDEYRLITKNTDRDGAWDKQFKINLSSKSKRDDKRFLFNNLNEEEVIPEDKSKGYKYGVELEIGVGYNEDNLEKYVYTVFHRAIALEERENTSEPTYKSNDDAWSGFNFDTKKEEETPF
jgi:hypothetical protein